MGQGLDLYLRSNNMTRPNLKIIVMSASEDNKTILAVVSDESRTWFEVVHKDKTTVFTHYSNAKEYYLELIVKDAQPV